MRHDANVVVVSERLFDTIKGMFYIARIFGLSPMVCTKSKTNYILQKSTALTIYSNLFMAIFVSTSLYCWTQLGEYETVYTIRFEDTTSRYVTISDIGIVLLSTFSSVLISTFKITKFADFLNCLTTIDSLLQKFPHVKTSRYMRATVIIMALSTSVLCFDYYMWIKTADKDQTSTYLLLVLYFPYYICYYYTMINELIYFHLIDFIKCRLVLLNQKLVELNYKMCDDLKRVSRKKFNMVIDTLRFADDPGDSVKKFSISTKDTQDLLNAYEKIVEACNKANEFFGLIILVILVGCLVHLLVTPYSLYKMLQNTGNSIFIISQSIWMIGHILRLILMVEPCHGCTEQSKLAIENVYKLLSRDLSVEVRRQFDILGAYLAQCKIEFTAYDFTTIDRFLLTTVAGTVTTYLVILFQFNK